MNFIHYCTVANIAVLRRLRCRLSHILSISSPVVVTFPQKTERLIDKLCIVKKFKGGEHVNARQLYLIKWPK